MTNTSKRVLLSDCLNRILRFKNRPKKPFGNQVELIFKGLLCLCELNNIIN